MDLTRSRCNNTTNLHFKPGRGGQNYLLALKQQQGKQNKEKLTGHFGVTVSPQGFRKRADSIKVQHDIIQVCPPLLSVCDVFLIQL